MARFSASLAAIVLAVTLSSQGLPAYAMQRPGPIALAEDEADGPLLESRAAVVRAQDFSNGEAMLEVSASGIVQGVSIGEASVYDEVAMLQVALEEPAEEVVVMLEEDNHRRQRMAGSAQSSASKNGRDRLEKNKEAAAALLKRAWTTGAARTMLLKDSRQLETSLARKGEQQYHVVWHVRDHAEGSTFDTESAARAEFANLVGGPWAARLYRGTTQLDQYGAMGGSDWDMLDAWVNQAPPMP